MTTTAPQAAPATSAGGPTSTTAPQAAPATSAGSPTSTTAPQAAPATSAGSPTTAGGLEATIERGVAHLLSLQSSEGWWKGELETNVTMEAEDLLLRRFLGILTEGEAEGSGRWIRSAQREDGTWATFYGGPADLSTTVEGYVALRLAGDRADAPHMERAAAYVRGAGGIERSRVFTRFWLALFGAWPWERLPVVPPELVLLPRWVPLNIYDFGCWARQTLVALSVVAAHRPVRPLGFGLDELSTGAGDRPAGPIRTWGGLFARLDRVLHRYERHPVRPLRAHALRKAEGWIVRRQEADGSWGGIQPPWVYSILALHLQGYPLDHPVLRAALDGLDRFTVDDPAGRRIEACQSPVWDTALAVVALADAGGDAPGGPGVGAGAHPGAHPGGSPGADPIARAAGWLVDHEITVPGDWSVRRPNLPPGGWAFEFANVNYPDIDDTAEVVLALHRAGVTANGPAGANGPPGAGRGGGAVVRGIDWVLGMQCRDGGWGAFDVDNTRALCRELPFCDFGELIDPPSADVTAHVVEMLAVVAPGRPDADAAVARGVAWLLDHQEDDGSWFGRWGANHLYGTGAVVPALVAAGAAGVARVAGVVTRSVAPEVDRAVTRAVTWLLAHQNDDGGWGEDLRSYTDPAWRGRGRSTASQTAWALLALLAAAAHLDLDRDLDRARGAACARGVGFLEATQREDGTWEEPWYTGTGFPGDFSINYHLYRLVFPLMALGRYRASQVAVPGGDLDG